MELLGLDVPIYFLLIPLGIFFGWCFWKLANEDLQRPDPNKEWSPEVDKAKAETLRNHGPGGMDR